MDDNRFDAAVTSRVSRRRPAARVVADLDAIAALAADSTIANRLALARRAALDRLHRTPAPSGHWINWAPAGLALALVVVTAWGLLVNSADNIDADLLADSLPFDAYLDAGFERSIGLDDVELIEN